MKKLTQEIVRRTRGRDIITHQLPKALQVDEVIEFGKPEAGGASY